MPASRNGLDMILGAHVSAAGGVAKVFQRAADIEAECVQLFTRAPSQWGAKPLSEAGVLEFHETRAQFGQPQVFAHDIYLTNLASSDPEVRERSLQSLIAEIERCTWLQLDGLVCHLGSNPDEAEGLRLLADGLGKAIQATEASSLPILMETTAGQGSCLGHRFEHLAYCLEHNSAHSRLQVCLDTCHVLAGGYPIDGEAGFQETLDDFSQQIGLDRLKLLHLNDSKKPLASRVDRHQHVGQGFVGLECFRRLVQHPELQGVCGIIETPEMETHHRVNLNQLKALRLVPGG